MTGMKTHSPAALPVCGKGTTFLACFVFCAMVTVNAQEPVATPIEPTPIASATDTTPKASADLTADKLKDSTPQLTYRIPKREERYLLGAGDTVLITVFRYPELSRSVRIEADGTIRLPLIHADIQASCLTTEQLATEVAKQYLEYLKDPQVDVSIRDYSSEPVAVVGAVNKPGSFALQRRARLREILAFAGGPSPAAGRLVQIMHDDSSGSACQAPSGVAKVESLSPSATPAASTAVTNDSTNGAAPPTISPKNENTTASGSTAHASPDNGNTSTSPASPASGPTRQENPDASASKETAITASTSGPNAALPTATGTITPAPGITYVDLVDLMQGGATDPYIRPGDIINIPEASSAFVIGDVNHPTVVPLNKQIMLSRAIALAGGPTPNARSSKVRIVRYINGKGGNTQIVVNLKDIYSNKREDIALRAGDIVDVPGSTAKSIMKSILWLGSWWGVYNAYNIIQ